MPTPLRTAAWLAPCLLFVGAACPGPAPQPPLGPWRIDAVTSSVRVDSNGVFALWRGEDELLSFPLDAFQLGTVFTLDNGLSYDPFWLENTEDPVNPGPPRDLEWRRLVSTDVQQEGPTRLLLRQTFEGGARAEVTLEAADEGHVTMRWAPVQVPADEAVAWMRVRARADDSEGFYGLGGWFDAVNHRGRLRPMQMEADLSLEGGNNEVHTPVPFLVGTTGWGLFVASRRLGLFDVARKESDLVEVTYGTAEESAAGLLVHLFAEEQPLDLTRHYYRVTGQPRLPAPWALGPWLWRNENRDQAQVLDDIRLIRELDLATSGIWIDRPYATRVNTFDFKPSQFPDAPAMIQAIRDHGLRLALWHTPYLEPEAQPFLDEAEAAGYFPPTPGVRLNHWGDLLDLTNTSAFAWWQGLIRRYTDLGVEGFKLDYAEDVLPSLYDGRNTWRFSDGSTSSA